MEDYPTPLADNVADNQVHELTATYLTLGEQNACAIFDNGKNAKQELCPPSFSVSGCSFFPMQRLNQRLFFFSFFSFFLEMHVVRGCPPGVVSRVEGVGKWRMPAWSRFTRGGAG